MTSQNMQISFSSLQEQYLEIKGEIDTAVSRVLNSGWYVLGSEVEEFERSSHLSVALDMR